MKKLIHSKPKTLIKCKALLAEGPVWNHRTKEFSFVDILNQNIFIYKNKKRIRKFKSKQMISNFLSNKIPPIHPFEASAVTCAVDFPNLPVAGTIICPTLKVSFICLKTASTFSSRLVFLFKKSAKVKTVSTLDSFTNSSVDEFMLLED